MPDLRKNASKRLLQLSERLVSVTRSNKSIRLLRKTKAQCFDAAEVDTLRPNAAAELLKAVMLDKSNAILTHRDSPVDPREARHELFIDEDGELEETETPEYRRLRLFRKLDSTLVQLSRNTAAIEAETGAMDLYFGYPWLSGTCEDVDATFLQAPVLLYPVQIRVERNPRLQWFVEPRDDAQPVFNEALMLALQQYHNSKLSEEFIAEAEGVGDDRALGDDPFALIDWFHTQFKDLGFRMTEPIRQISPLPEFKAAEVPNATEGFTLTAHTVVGYFPQAGSALRRDYEALIPLSEGDAIPSVLRRFLDAGANYEPGNGGGQLATMDETSEADTCWIVPSDASQESAMLKVRDEPCTVIHGPPGTGKSQVICNLISDALSRNQRVLVCCQKRAALDVVFQRLEKEGLGSALALVHDHANDRQLLYSRIAAALAPVDNDQIKYQAQEIDDLAKSIDEATAKLRQIADELHRPRRCGMTARQLYTAATRISRPTDLELLQFAQQFEVGSLERFSGLLTRLRAEHAKLDDRAAAWSGRTSFARLTFVDAERITKALQSVSQAANALKTRFDQLAEPRPTPGLAGEADEALADLSSRIAAADEQLLSIAQANQNPTTAGTTKAALKALERLLGDKPTIPNRPPSTLEGGTLDEASLLEVYNLGRRKLFRILNSAWRRARASAQQTLSRNGLADSSESVSELAAQIRAAHYWSKLDKAVDGTLLAPAVAQALTAADIKSAMLSTTKALELVSNLAAFFKAWPKLHQCFESLSGDLAGIGRRADEYRRLGAALAEARETVKALSPYLVEKALSLLDNQAAEQVDSFVASIGQLQSGLVHFETLQRIDDVKEGLRPVELRAYRRLSKMDTNWTEVLTSAVYWGWLEEVEKEARTLRTVATGEVGDLRAQFRSQLDRRRTLNGLKLAAQLRQRATNPRFEPGRDIDGRHSVSRPWTRLKDEVVKKR
ncbi:MAG: AAA domain-containing protein [Planctomycetota bacterium]